MVSTMALVALILTVAWLALGRRPDR